MLAALRPIADEIVVAVDSRVDVALLGAYDPVVDRVVRFDFRPPVDRPRAWLASQCSGDWVLSIDGDEVPSRALVEALPRLVAARDVVQYWLPRRWLFPTPTTWLTESPWWPDFQVRLLRNGGTLASRAELHAGFVAMLPSRHVDAPLYHLDCVVNDAATRAAKVERYETELPGRSAYGGGGLNEVMYRPERWSCAPVRAVPAADREVLDAVLAARAGAVDGHAPPRPPSRPVELVAAADIDAAASCAALAAGDYAVGLELFEGAGGDLRLAPAEVRPLYVTVENRGRARWRWGLEQQPEIRVSYHWRAPDGAMVAYEGLRSPLPCPIDPGDSAIVPVWVEAPSATGRYRLEIDLVHEHVRWFESPLVVEVVVAERAPATPTTDATTPTAPTAPTAPTIVPEDQRC